MKKNHKESIMFKLNTCQQIYPILLIKSIGKKSFQALGSIICKTGKSIQRWMVPSDQIFNQNIALAKQLFADKKTIYLAIDDTLIKKIYSRFMRGSGWFYDSKIRRKIVAYKVMCAAIGDSKHLIPVGAAFLFDKDLLGNLVQSKNDIVKNMILSITSHFKDKNVIVVMDGLYATKELLGWASKKGLKVEVRMHSNRTVWYKGKYVMIREISRLTPKGRHFQRTIRANWHGIVLDITGHRRVDKHGNETIVFQAATYQASASYHVNVYNKRWPIEKCFRTCKQQLGLQDCFSTKMDVQLNHIASVFQAYALVQLEMKKRKIATPEKTIRLLKTKKIDFLIQRIAPSGQIFKSTYA